MRKIFSKFLCLRKTCGFEFIVLSFNVAERLGMIKFNVFGLSGPALTKTHKHAEI